MMDLGRLITGVSYGMIALSAGLITYAALVAATRAVDHRRDRLFRNGGVQLSLGRGTGPPWLATLQGAWQRLAERRATALGVRGHRWVGVAYAGLFTAALIAAVYVGGRSSSSPVIGALLGAFAVLAPETVMQALLQVRDERMARQLALAVQVFSTEVSTTAHVPRALANTAARVDEPIRSGLLAAVRRLEAGGNYRQVIAQLGEALGEYGPAFAHLLLATWNDTRAGAMCADLGITIADELSWRRKSDASISGIRMLGVFLNVLILPAFWAVTRYVPESRAYLFGTAEGHRAIVLSLLSVVVGLAMNRWLP